MSCTAGYGSEFAGRSGTPSGRPPTWDGISDGGDAQPARIAAVEETSTRPVSARRCRPSLKAALRDFNILLDSFCWIVKARWRQAHGRQAYGRQAVE